MNGEWLAEAFILIYVGKYVEGVMPMDVISLITVLGYTMTVFGLGFTLGRYTKK